MCTIVKPISYFPIRNSVKASQFCPTLSNQNNDIIIILSDNVGN